MPGSMGDQRSKTAEGLCMQVSIDYEGDRRRLYKYEE